MTNDLENLTQRIVVIEERCAYQDDTIEKLNAALTSQWAVIDVLQRQAAELRDRLQDAESRTPGGPGDEKPPHY